MSEGWHRRHRPCKGRARHLGCAARDLDQKPDRGCLGAEEGLHTRATLTTDRCHLNDAAVRINRDHRDDTAIGEEEISGLSCNTTFNKELWTSSFPLYSMKPNLRNFAWLFGDDERGCVGHQSTILLILG
jgi:hypothetical protein